MSRPWELCRVCSLISRISFRSRSKAGEIKFFLTSGPAVGDGERVYKWSPRTPSASRAPAGPCGGEDTPEAAGPSVPTAGRRRRRMAEPVLPAPGPGTPPARLRLPGPPAPRLAGGPTELGRPRPRLGKRGPRGLPAGFARSRQGSFPATGASYERPIESKRGKVMNGPFALSVDHGLGFPG